MANEGPDLDQDLKALNSIYDELSQDARTVVRDLSESISAYYLLGAYMLAFSFGMDLYVILTRSIAASDYGTILLWIVFINLIPITTGCFILHRYRKMNARYRTLFRLEKDIRLKEATGPARKKGDRD